MDAASDDDIFWDETQKFPGGVKILGGKGAARRSIARYFFIESYKISQNQNDKTNLSRIPRSTTFQLTTTKSTASELAQKIFENHGRRFINGATKKGVSLEPRKKVYRWI